LGTTTTPPGNGIIQLGGTIMATNSSVDKIAAEIAGLSRDDREALLVRMAKMGDLLEELEDVADLLRSAREPARPYEEFLNELKAEGREV
jgi:hypothetical protein